MAQRPHKARPGPRPAVRGSPPAPQATGGQQWLFGTHAVTAALANPERVCRRLLATAEAAERLGPTRLPAEPAERAQLDRLLPGAVHQGLALLADSLPTVTLDDLLGAISGDSLFVILDQVTDPHNVGAILRSAAAFGATALILPERHSPPLGGTLAKAASGAVERIPVIRVVNLARALAELGDAGVTRIGLDDAGTAPLADLPLGGAAALVLGAEGEGLRRLTRERCDHLARLPTQPDFPALNVSNAAAVALYAVRLRLRVATSASLPA